MEPTTDSNRTKATVKRINATYLFTDTGVFVHRDSFANRSDLDRANEGEILEFDLVQSDKGPRGENATTRPTDDDQGAAPTR